MTRTEKIAYEAERKRRGNPLNPLSNKGEGRDQGKEKITRSYNGINARTLSDVD